MDTRENKKKFNRYFKGYAYIFSNPRFENNLVIIPNLFPWWIIMKLS